MHLRIRLLLLSGEGSVCLDVLAFYVFNHRKKHNMLKILSEKLIWGLKDICLKKTQKLSIL